MTGTAFTYPQQKQPATDAETDLWRSLAQCVGFFNGDTSWQRLLVLSISFHHANLRLPDPVERVLSLMVMTPRLHGIHHSVDPELRNSNWSSGLTLWDRLHRTYRTEPRLVLRLGVEGVPPARELGASLVAPLSEPK